MFTIQITENVSRAVQALQRRASTLAPLMHVIGRALKTRTQLGFRLGVDPYGQAWRPLRHRNGQPLRDTGRLQRSIDYDAGASHVDIGTNVAYGIVHQFGATVKAPVPAGQTSLGGYVTTGAPTLVFKGKGGVVIHAKQVTIPPRPFLPTGRLPEAWGSDIIAAINDYLDDGLDAA